MSLQTYYIVICPWDWATWPCWPYLSTLASTLPRAKALPFMMELFFSRVFICPSFGKFVSLFLWHTPLGMFAQHLWELLSPPTGVESQEPHLATVDWGKVRYLTQSEPIRFLLWELGIWMHRAKDWDAYKQCHIAVSIKGNTDGLQLLEVQSCLGIFPSQAWEDVRYSWVFSANILYA